MGLHPDDNSSSARNSGTLNEHKISRRNFFLFESTTTVVLASSLLAPQYVVGILIFVYS